MPLLILSAGAQPTGLRTTRTRLDFQGPSGLAPYTEIVSGGLPPYAASSSDPAVATVAQATSPNVVPNSDTLAAPWGLSGALALSNGGPNGANDFEYTGTGSAMTANIDADSPLCSVIPGTSYKASWWADFSQVTHGLPDMNLYDINYTTIQDVTMGLGPGSPAGRYAGPAWTCPTNLAPHSDDFSGWALTGCALGTGGPNGAVDIEVSGTGSAQTFDSQSPSFSVTPGTTMVASVFLNASCTFTYTGEQPRMIVYDITHGSEIAGGDIYFTSGTNARMNGSSFTVPAGCTAIRLQPHCATTGLTIPSGQKLKISQPMLEAKSSASGYYISSQNPQVRMRASAWSGQSGGFIVASGQKLKFSQPMLAPSTYDQQTYIAQTAAFLITPIYRGKATITYTDSTP